MGICVQWDNREQTIIRYTFEGEWDWPDFEAAAEHSFTMTSSVQHRVHMIFDLTHTPDPPHRFVLFMRKLQCVAPNESGDFILVGGGEVGTATVELLRESHRGFSHRVFYEPTLRAARGLIYGEDTQPARPANFHEQIKNQRAAYS